MKYYLHDTSSFSDEKITQVFMKFGYEGLGLFYTILEKIALQEKPISTEVLKKQLFVGKKLEKCWSFLEEIGIISSNNHETFNERILSYSETYQIRKEKNKERISQWRESQEVIKNVTRYESVCNTPKVKEREVKESKVNASKEAAPIFSHSVDKVVECLWNAADQKWWNINDSACRKRMIEQANKLVEKYKNQPCRNIQALCNEWAINMKFEPLKLQT